MQNYQVDNKIKKLKTIRMLCIAIVKMNSILKNPKTMKKNHKKHIKHTTL
jgi:hypothetical protein